MSSKNNNEHFFDQDFEVTYEDDPIFHYEEEPLTKREFQTVDLKSQPKPRASGKKKKNIQMPLQGDETILMDPITNGSVSPQSGRKNHQWEEEPDRRKNPSCSKRPISDSDDYEDERPAEKSLLPKGKVTCFPL